MRKASYGIIALGLLVGVVIDRADQVTIGADTPEQFWDQLRSQLAGVFVGVAIRVVASFVALTRAYPLARARETTLPPRAYLGSSLTGIFDRLHAARAYRSLRWTHHVRQVALARLGTTGRRLSHLEPDLGRREHGAVRDRDRGDNRARRIARLSSSAAERRERPELKSHATSSTTLAIHPSSRSARSTIWTILGHNLLS